MEMIKLDWSSIRAVTLKTGTDSVDEIVKRHLPIFMEGYGSSRDFKAKIYLRPETTPVFRKARPVPFARREMVAAELDRLEASDIITKVERSDWATPTVNVVKTDKSIRVCGDYKVTVNPHVMVDKYPLPFSGRNVVLFLLSLQFCENLSDVLKEEHDDHYILRWLRGKFFCIPDHSA